MSAYARAMMPLRRPQSAAGRANPIELNARNVSATLYPEGSAGRSTPPYLETTRLA
jgi:hypothetical protein